MLELQDDVFHNLINAPEFKTFFEPQGAHDKINDKDGQLKTYGISMKDVDQCFDYYNRNMGKTFSSVK